MATTLNQYDFNGNLTNISELGKSCQWTYDAYNRPASYTDASGYLIQYRYDANGNLTNLIYPGGRTVTNFFDSLNRLTSTMDWAGRQTVYTYDLASRITTVSNANGTVRSNFYDSGGELTNFVEQQATTRAPVSFFKLSYNAVGRIQWEFAAPLPSTNIPPSRTMGYDADNRPDEL